MSKTFAYVRVSSRTQNEARQLEALKKLDVDHIIVEKASGKNFIDRTEYKKLKSMLRKGDTLIIHSLDRLGRSLREVPREFEDLVNMGVGINVLDMPILNTANNELGLTGELITKIVVTLLSYVAESERVNNKTRQREGIAAAKLRGQKFGRPVITELPQNFKRAYELYSNKVVNLKEALRIANMSKSTFYWYQARMKSLQVAI